jgi:hypothetical protein
MGSRPWVYPPDSSRHWIPDTYQPGSDYADHPAGGAITPIVSSTQA